jgi:NADPH:quinone reductase-like Zn-dependent oxidoreductase
MKAIKVGAQPGLERLQLVELSEPKGPAHGEIRVRIHATSLNYHDRAAPRH